MRISSDPSDVGFDTWINIRHHRDVRVLIDGVPTNALTADDVEGFVTRPVYGLHGRPQPDPERPDRLLMETVRGRVEIVVPDPDPDLPRQ